MLQELCTCPVVFLNCLMQTVSISVTVDVMFDRIASLVLTAIALVAIGLALVTWHNWQAGQATVARLDRQLAGLQFQVRQMSNKKSVISPPETITSLAANGNDVTQIVYNQYGFDPGIDKVPVGTPLSIKNDTSLPLYVQALDWYGRAITVSPLNLGTINAGQSASFVIKSAGAYQYQGNHNPAIRAEIEVK